MKIVTASFIILFFVIACKKQGDLKISPPPPPPADSIPDKEIAIFTVTSECHGTLSDSVAYRDSVLLFNNYSRLLNDTDTRIHEVAYQWNFGDQTGSTEKDPRHRYSKTGFYTVTLYTYLDKKISDTMINPLWIVLGQREFRLNSNTIAADADDASEAGQPATAVLFLEWDQSFKASYGIFKADSLLNIQWINRIPGNADSIRLSSMQKINTGGFILSGNYIRGITNQFCLSKINSSGNLTWSKYISNMHGWNTFTTPVSDGGFLTAGNSDTAGHENAAIVKCDENGNELWRRRFERDPILWGINNIVETSDGYVFAAIEYSTPVQLVLTKLDFNGNFVKQVAVQPVSDINSGAAGVVYNGNTFCVYATNPGYNSYLYYFDDDFLYTGNKQISAEPVKGGFARDNSFDLYTAGNQYSEVLQFAADKSLNWNHLVTNLVYLSCGLELYGPSRWCKRAFLNADNDIMVLCDGVNTDNKSSVYLEKITGGGMIK